MWGAIAGDMIGSVYERRMPPEGGYPLFGERSCPTDDSVLTVAVADALLGDQDYARALRQYGRRYPRAGYGGAFTRWLAVDDCPAYGSWGNGSAMRVSPVGWAMDSVETVLAEAERSAVCTHSHPEGIKGAQSVALAVFMARQGADRHAIRDEISGRFGYRLGRTLDGIRPTYHFDVSCQGSVPESLIAFIESTGVEDAIRKAISLAGDADTMACIAGGVAEAYYGGVPAPIAGEVRSRLPGDLLSVADAFAAAYMGGRLPGTAGR